MKYKLTAFIQVKLSAGPIDLLFYGEITPGYIERRTFLYGLMAAGSPTLIDIVQCNVNRTCNAEMPS